MIISQVFGPGWGSLRYSYKLDELFEIPGQNLLMSYPYMSSSGLP